MKKVLVALFLILPLACIAEEFGLNVPQWKDFAPSAYVNVEAPKKLGKFNVTAKYWYERKVAFEEAVVNCKYLETYEEQFSCFEDLKSKQFRENSDYNARIEAKQSAMSGIPEMNNRTDTMIPIGGYMNPYTQLMPNELRGY